MTLLFALDPVSQSEKGANRVKRERERGSCFKPSNKDRERERNGGKLYRATTVLSR